MKVGDLCSTKVYHRLKEVYDKGEPMPQLVNQLTDKVELEPLGVWGDSLEQSKVLVERVVVYWSRVCKRPETRYSATEREALAAKEALVKFMPFIEGEELLLVTDHSALQWARTLENYN